ncbi:Inositol-pentakisphosphate 2-kinase [Linum grandiflorum]
MMESKLGEKDAEDWVYRGEGAANIVLSYSGSSPAFAGKVMRMQKVARNGSSVAFQNQPALTEHERLLWKETKELVASPNKEAAERLFAHFVMGPLLGPNHVDAGTLVRVSREFLQCVEQKLIGVRPSSRVDAAKLDTEADSVVIMSDHTVFPPGDCKSGPCISVEIKPKCGFLPVSSFIAERNAVKKTTTRFRMHQALKLCKKEISEISKYSPLDLFSGSKERIHKAIKDLFATPQNNFRVFLNGSLILGGLGGGTSKTSSVIEKSFEDALNGAIQGTEDSRTASLMQLVAETVHHSGVLDRLLEVQKLDRFDIEGAIHAYYNVVSKPCTVCRDLKDAKSMETVASLHSIPMDESLKIVKDFLIAASAKDCSLMFSFTATDDAHGSIHLPSSSQKFHYKVNFIDLDLKRLKKIEEYYKLDQKIVKCYNQMGEGEYMKLNPASSLVHGAVN